jgi:Uma2 family endonuclease
MDGHRQLIAMAPISSEHAGRINRLNRLLVTIVGVGGVVAPQNPIRLSNIAEPPPDFAVLRPRADDYTSATPLPADVLLVVEVADSSLDYDGSVKQRLYALAGIPEYWLVDVNRRVVRVCRDPQGEEYRAVAVRAAGDELPMPGTSGAVIPVAAIFA